MKHFGHLQSSLEEALAGFADSRASLAATQQSLQTARLETFRANVDHGVTQQRLRGAEKQAADAQDQYARLLAYTDRLRAAADKVLCAVEAGASHQQTCSQSKRSNLSHFDRLRGLLHQTEPHRPADARVAAQVSLNYQREQVLWAEQSETWRCRQQLQLQREANDQLTGVWQAKVNAAEARATQWQ